MTNEANLPNDHASNTALVQRHVTGWNVMGLGPSNAMPWDIISKLEMLVAARRDALIGYIQREGFAIHPSAAVEDGVILKGPGIIGPRCYIAAGAYLRGGIFLAEDCVIGPSSELKTSILLAGSKLAHLNFVGDSIIGADVNIEAGAIVANYRNELEDKLIRIEHGGRIIDTGVTKFGALIGDGTRIGANAVISPGAILAPGSRVGRLQLIDQCPR